MTLPDYIQRGGDIVGAQPTNQTGTTMYAFAVPSALQPLNELLDAQLNTVLQRAASTTSYAALLPVAFIIYANIAELRSETPPYSTRGWMPERDFSIWIPALETSPSGKRLVFYLPYVFVDNVSAMASGREIFGFFKQTALLGEGGALPLSIDALAIREFSPSSETAVMRLLTATESDDKTPSATAILGDISKQTIGDVRTELWRWLQKLAPNADLTALRDDIQTNGFPLVFLKQFRDIEDPGKACYQAVTTTRLTPTVFNSINAIPHYKFDIPPVASHPIVSDCGFSGQQFRDTFGLKIDVNFVVEAGSVIGAAT